MEAFYITNPKNIRYLTGFTGEDSALLLLKEQAYFITDGRYTEQAKEEIPVEIKIIKWSTGLIADAQNLINSAKTKNVFFEGEAMTYQEFLAFNNGLDVSATSFTGLIEEFRKVKDDLEISYTKKAVEIIDKTFLHILDFIKPGLTERDVAAEMEYHMKKLGSEGVSFETIVASGIRSSYPHGEASSKVIEVGEIITLDFGATYQGYASDMTRTIALGNIDERLEKIYYDVLEAEENGLKAICSGMKSKELDSHIRKSLIDKGLNQFFNHGAGHSIGLDIHEAPFISGNSEDIFKTNMIQTIEPGVYIEGLGGVRIEDDVLVQEKQSIVLTQSSKKQLIKLPFR